MSPKSTIEVAKIDSLTGMRFLAAMMVFCFHLDRFLKTNATSGPLGSIAVSFFFVLSGFILTYVYRNRLTRGGLKRFYFTRWARIWPLHAACLLAALCLMPHGKPVDFPLLRTLSHAFLIQSWIPQGDYALGLNSVAWSISTEAFFYLMFPIFLLGGVRHFLWKFLTTAAVTAASLVVIMQLATIPDWTISQNLHYVVHLNPLLRLLEFALGMATAYAFIRLRTSTIKVIQVSSWPVAIQTIAELLVLTAAATSFYIFRSYGFYRWIAFDVGWGDDVKLWFVYCGGAPLHALCIFVFAQSNGLLSRVLRTKTMIFLGEISFALYMVHRIVIWVVLSHFWTGSTLPYWVMVSSCLVMSLGVSSLLYLLVEMPMKTALLNCYDKNYATAARGVGRTTWNLFAQRSTYGFLAMVLVPVIGLNIATAVTNTTEPVSQIVEEFDQKPVGFGDKVTLAAWKFEPRRMGTEVSLVWKTEQPAIIRHRYSMTGTKFKCTGRINLPQGETIQRFFVLRRFWLEDESVEIKLWHRNIPLPTNAKPNTDDDQRMTQPITPKIGPDPGQRKRQTDAHYLAVQPAKAKAVVSLKVDANQNAMANANTDAKPITTIRTAAKGQ